MEKKIILKAENLKKNYSINKSVQIEILKGIDLEILESDIDLIIGASGAGKSTLLHILGGLDKPTDGKVFYMDQNISNMNEENLSKFRNKEIGFIFQFHHLLPEFTCIENVAIPAMIQKKSKNEIFKRAEELLIEVGLKDRIHHKPNEISGGEQQRVAVARALINSPKIIFADEPSGNLDSKNSELLYELIFDLKQKYSQTFIIVTHNLDLIKKADNVYKIVDGKINNDIIS